VAGAPAEVTLQEEAVCAMAQAMTQDVVRVAQMDQNVVPDMAQAAQSDQDEALVVHLEQGVMLVMVLVAQQELVVAQAVQSDQDEALVARQEQGVVPVAAEAAEKGKPDSNQY